MAAETMLLIKSRKQLIFSLTRTTVSPRLDERAHAPLSLSSSLFHRVSARHFKVSCTFPRSELHAPRTEKFVSELFVPCFFRPKVLFVLGYVTLRSYEAKAFLAFHLTYRWSSILIFVHEKKRKSRDLF